MNEITRRGFLRHTRDAGVAIGASRLLGGCTAPLPITPDNPTAESIARRCVPNPEATAIYDQYYAMYQLTHQSLHESLSRLTHTSRQ